MIDLEKINLDFDFKVLHQNGSNYICDSSASEFRNLEEQNCWKPPNIHDAGIR